MKLLRLTPLTLTVLSLSLAMPALAQSQAQSDNYQDQVQPLHGEHEAMRMVPAQAALKTKLDAAKLSPGSTFEAVLSRKIQLQNGPTLPEGTVLLGSVATDDMNINGTSKLALRFTQANLKNGQQLPIKATIVNIYQPDDTSDQGYPVQPGDQVPNNWNDGTLAVDQIDVVSGVDLHSRIASMNSGVLVSTRKSDVKLREGSEFALAIAARPADQATAEPPANQ